MHINKPLLIAAVIFGIFAIPNSALGKTDGKEALINVNLHYKNNNINIVSIGKNSGYLPDYLNQPQNGYALVLRDSNNKEIFKVKFNFPTVILSDDFSGKQASGSVQELSEADQTVTTPYLSDAKKVYILNPNGQVIVSQDLNFEKLQTYAQDQKNVAQKAKTEMLKKYEPAALAIGAIIATALGLFLYWKHKKQTTQKEITEDQKNLKQ